MITSDLLDEKKSTGQLQMEILSSDRSQSFVDFTQTFYTVELSLKL